MRLLHQGLVTVPATPTKMAPMAAEISYRNRFQNALGAQKYADRFERRSHRHIANRETRALGRILSQLSDVNSILDMPAGAGRFLRHLWRDGRTILEIDVAHEMLALGRQRGADLPRTHWVQGDAFHLPLADAAVDLVFCNRLLHHFRDSSQRVQLLKELRRISRKHVVVSFFDYHRFGRLRLWLKRLRGRRPDYTGQPTRQEFQREVAQAGLRLMKVQPTGPAWVSQCYWLLEKTPAGEADLPA